MKESGVNSGGKGSPASRTGDSQEYQACSRYFLNKSTYDIRHKILPIFSV